VGPNNGILSVAAKREGIEKTWKITESFFGEGVSHTFHGRDVFVKAGVLLSQGKAPEEFLCEEIPSSRLQVLTFQEGQVLHIDDYGNIKIHYSSPLTVGSNLLFKIHEKKYTIPTVITFTDVPLGAPLIYQGSSNTLELAVHQDSAANYFNLCVGDILTIK
jgi:S-adenosylmethionine hydrolase